MNKIFENMTPGTVYERCILAALAHAVMNGRYPELAAEQLWEWGLMKNYSFLDMEGIRGAMSFKDDYFVCVLRNESSFIFGKDRLLREFFGEADEDIRRLAAEQTMMYLFYRLDGKTEPAASAAFYGRGGDIFSVHSEAEIMRISENVIYPFVCSENEALEHWEGYNDMTKDQAELVMEIYRQRIGTEGHLTPDIPIIKPLTDWFGEDISECIETFNEMEIFPE